MKKQQIYMKSWLELHGRVKRVETDDWYLDFANKLFYFVNDSYFFGGETEERQERVALMLALYLEDCVADEGNWREFIRWHKENYGSYLPFYALPEDYMPDEVNFHDVAFLLWAANSPEKEEGKRVEVENPIDQELLEFTEWIYKWMEDVFEQAPISENLAPDWLLPAEQMQKECTPLPEPGIDGKLPHNVERFLKASGGESLMFFHSYKVLKRFFIEDLHWENTEDELMPELAGYDNFVLYANAKGLLIATDVTEYFATPRNPLYNGRKAMENAYNMFCKKGICPFDLLKYAMKHNLLPDAQFPFEEKGKELLHENWDFVARWFLGEYYEGD